MGLGLAVGLLLSPSGAGLLAEETAESTGPWIALPGNLFLALIKMVVIPLVLSSIILGLTSTEDADFLKKALPGATVWTSALPGQGGEWRFSVAQKYQALDIEARYAGRELTVRGHRLRGEEIKIAVTGRADGAPAHYLFQGTVQGGRITGSVRISNGEEIRTLPWTATRVP